MPKYTPGRFSALITEAIKLLRRARRNRHSLAGNGYYARAYWKIIGEFKREGHLLAIQLGELGLHEEVDLLHTTIDRVASHQDSAGAEEEMVRLRTLCVVKLEPCLYGAASPKRAIKSFLPPEFCTSVPRFLRPVFEQVQGCYAYEFRDAALVMLRKLVESLIIEGYEVSGRGSEIKKNGNYLQFGDLVGKATSGTLFRLSRDSKIAIEDVKKLGDNAAHTLHFHARKSEVDQLRKGARILLEDLLKTIEGLPTTA